MAEIRNYTMNFGPQHPAAHGAAPKGPDVRVQKITANLLARMKD